ncbi:hypothetical protein L1987_49840 [Smallanthus sonchifolius]|uniref:Uncharacterized protein n=1 Tax=Smallanthus sonchifolius TaxID=185202 RepID=A0ACB9FV65_9ASTR|nr:hypothetical protein L1987_49840 [Smallanthus sonchifolius]
MDRSARESNLSHLVHLYSVKLPSFLCPVTMEGGGEVTREKTRIYVGGLGAGVTEDDLRKTFAALGEVVSVDVVRTKGRSFAYLDFLPASDKSLPKLFSTYNGCMWKGGKLRLEKAKEHYLVKLKREWQEESEHASKASDNCNGDATNNHDTSEKPKKPSPVDKTQIHIFFPKLGKVKSLAQVGIGKHKYSFQRIQVPPIPTHFCDCEEHSLAFPPPSKKQSSEIDDASYGINEQELNIMNSVMNKIFERANPSKQVIERSESENGKDELIAAETDEEDHLTDEDNLIINVANRRNDNMDLLGEMRAMMANQEPVAKKINTSTEKPNSVNDNPRKKTVALTKKRKSSHSEETSRNSQTRLDTQENSKKEVELVTKQSGNSSLRSLKSTWKDLIGQKRDTSFSISDFIASIPQRKEETSNGDDTDHSLKKKDLVSNKKRKLEGDKNEPIPRTEVGEVTTENSIPVTIANDCQQKEEEPEANNLDLPLATIGQQFRIPDAVADVPDQKEEEPKTDDLDCNFENHENDQDLKKPTKDSPVKNDEDLNRTARGEFWRHKSSWTQLVSTASHSSFSISQIVPNTSFEKHDQQADTFDSQPANKNLEDQIPIVRKEATLSPVKKKIAGKKRILSLGNLESDETCSFMRTEESVKEWKKAKASLSGSLNKKKRLVNESA